MVFRRPPGDRIADQGQVDYRLARAATLAALANGETDRGDVCDAHPELIRAADQLGTPVPGDCPICEGRASLVEVTYVFGPRLPSHGRCISQRSELDRLARRPGTHIAYVVEVCRSCHWNHLVRRWTLTHQTDQTDQTKQPD